MPIRRAVACVALSAGVALSLGCNPLSPLGGTALFPTEARLGAASCTPCKGATIAFSIDSNYAPATDSAEHHGAWSQSVAGVVTSNVTLQLEDPGGAWTAPLTVRGVFSSRTQPGSQAALAFPGAEISVALFDLPNETQIPVTLTYPATVRVRAVISGPSVPPRVAALTLLGAGASPAVFWPEPLIAGLEFEIEYPPTVANPSVFLATEAVYATALVGPGSASGRTRVVIVDPKGFRLGDPINEDRAGEGPLVDVVFGTKTGAFTSSQFRIWSLFVTDVNGNVVLDRRALPLGPDSTSAFLITAVRSP